MESTITRECNTAKRFDLVVDTSDRALITFTQCSRIPILSNDLPTRYFSFQMILSWIHL